MIALPPEFSASRTAPALVACDAAGQFRFL